MKKGLAILYSPKTFVDFVWYYCTYGEDIQWDVICLQCDGDIKISDQCEKSGIFSHVYCDYTNYNKMDMRKKTMVFLELLIMAMIGKKKSIAQKKLEEIVGTFDYDIMVIGNDGMSLLSGLSCVLSKDVKTIILEDGITDYNSRTKKFQMELGLNFANLCSFIMAKLGYGNVRLGGATYYVECNKYCHKYSTHPEWMQYTNYKDIHKLNDFSYTNKELYRQIMNKSYSLKEKYVADIFLFTTPIKDMDKKNEDKLVESTIQYINDVIKPSSVLIKKHPRDLCDYSAINASVEYIDQNIPAELLLNLVMTKEYIFMLPSTVMISLNSLKLVNVLYYNLLKETYSDYQKIFFDLLNKIGLDNDNVIYLD